MVVPSYPNDFTCVSIKQAWTLYNWKLLHQWERKIREVFPYAIYYYKYILLEVWENGDGERCC
jgi:hypothetical protein